MPSGKRPVVSPELAPQQHLGTPDPVSGSDETVESKNLLDGFLKYLSLRAVGIILGYVTQIFLSRWLGPHHFGYYSLMATAAFVLAYIVGLGYPIAMQRFLPNYRAEGKWALFRGFVHYSVIKMTKASFVLAVLVGAGLAFVRAIHHSDDPWTDAETFGCVVTLLLIPVQGGQEAYEAGLTAQQRWLDSFVPSMVLTPVLFMAGIAVADYLTPGELLVYHVLFVYLAVNMFSTLIQRVLLVRSYPAEARNVAFEYDPKDWDATAKPVLVMTLFGIVTARADLFGVALFDGHSDAGIYAAVLATAELLNTFSKAANTVVTPLIGPLLAKKDVAGLQKVLIRSSQLATYPTLIFALFLTYAGTYVLDLFGNGYEGGYWALVVLTWNQVLIASAGPPSYVLIVSGHSVKVAQGFAISLVIQLVLLVVLTWKFQMLGASASSLIAGLFLRTILAYWVSKYTGIQSGFLGGITHKGVRG